MSTAQRAPTHSLLHYSTRVMLGNTYWLLVIPIAASQLVTFWVMALSSLFQPSVAATIAELFAPLVGAFLGCNAIAVEQRDQMDEIVFSKPSSARAIVARRLGLIVGFALLLTAVMLTVFRIGIARFNLGAMLLAAVPPTLFLTLLAMLVAAVSRNPFVGLAAAAAYWGLDFSVGPALNGVFTLRALGTYAAIPGSTVTDYLPNKIVLLVGSALLYWMVCRYVTQPRAPWTGRRWLRTAGATALVVFAYVYIGAAHKVALGLREKRADPRRSWQWYQRQFTVYGPVPVRHLFGRPFSLWVGPRRKGGGAAPGLGTEEHIQGWQELVQRYPRSMWADGAYYQLVHIAAARADEGADRHAAAEACTYAAELAQRHPQSPYSQLALLDAARCALGIGSTEDAVATYDLLLRAYPGTDGAQEAGRELVRQHEQRGELPLALEDALRWAEAAPPEGKSEACLTAGSLLDELRRHEDANRLYGQGEQAATAWLSLPPPANLTPAQHSAWVRKHADVAADLEELRARLAAPSP